MEKQNNFADIELAVTDGDDEKPNNPAKVIPDSKIDLVGAFFRGGISGAMTNMLLFFLVFFLMACISGLMDCLGSFFKVCTNASSQYNSKKNSLF